MVILGLTGSIGMGKSTAARDFRRLGVPVHDSDATVHRLMGPNGAAVEKVAALFPDCVRDGVVDRSALGTRVFKDPDELKQLEAILHPLVRRETNRFLGRCCRERHPMVVLDVPLLLEKGGERRCDAVCVVSAPKRIQRQRVLAREGMSEEKLQHILKHQMCDIEKRKRADFVIFSSLGRAFSLRTIRRISTIMMQQKGRHWPPFQERRM